MEDLTLALVQTELRWHQAAANRDRFAELITGLPEGPDLVVLPEMFTTGFTMEAEQVAEEMQGETLAWMRDTARTHELTLTGSLVIREQGRYYNRLIWMPPDGQFSCYDKRHLFRMAGEHEHYAAGTHRGIFEINGWRVCPLVCYDLRFPAWSRGIDEFDLLLYVANWPAARRSAWRTLLPARAVENLCYAAGVNRIGTDGKNIAYAGDSGAWDYLGNALADCEDREATTLVRLDASALRRYREKFPAHMDADRFRFD